jgi:Mannosylglycerate hydrolase MGH1-like glycoside hydrolase domain
VSRAAREVSAHPVIAPPLYKGNIVTFEKARLSVLVFAAISCAPIPVSGATEIQCPQRDGETGSFFRKKAYVSAPLPRYDEVKSQLPSPVDESHPLWIETYWKAWELAFKNFHEPSRGSGFVSQFIDAAFNENIFLWDSSFMTMFTNLAAPEVPGISTLDNFYAKQPADGEICREIVRSTGVCYEPWINRECKPLVSRFGWLAEDTSRVPRWAVTYKGRTAPSPNPLYTLDALDNPILAWAELESYRITGDKGRLMEVWEPLLRYYLVLQKYLQQGNGTYITDWASMDNSPRNPYLRGGGTGIDISSQMVLFARDLSQIAVILGKQKESERYTREADALSRVINHLLWDEELRFYVDLTLNGKQVPVRTVAAYWTLIARVAPRERAKRLAAELTNPKTFGRPNVVPTLAADEPLYDPNGGYWRGSVWAPTTTMVIRGLEAYGYHDLAHQIAIRHLNLVADVYKKTGTIWENYSPEKAAPGDLAKGDFVGWSGIGPILYLLEYGIGLRPDAEHNELLWDLKSHTRQGCDHYRFNSHVVSLVAQPMAGGRGMRITVDSDGDFTLTVAHGSVSKSFPVNKGRQQFTIGS